jgi:DNA-directed RNA polymerase specialized sigma24 family protein
MRRRLLALLCLLTFAGCVAPTGDPQGAGSRGLLLGPSDAPSRFDGCIGQLMRGEEARAKQSVQQRYRLSPDDAHDLVRDALISVCVQHAEHGYVNLGAALQRAVQNRAIGDWRRNKRYPSCPIDDQVPACDATDDGVRFDQEERAVAAAMCRLHPVSRRIVKQRITEDAGFDEIGREVGVPANEAKNRYDNAIKKLRAELGVACPALPRKNRPTAYAK